MTTVQQVYEGMQRLAPPELAEHWDNPGLLVDCGGAVRRVLVTLDITPEVVAEAAAKQCTVIVAHHPVIFDPLKRLCPADVPYQLVQAGISAICMHTNLDAAEGGVNDVLADLFGIRQRTAFADGCGRVGEIDPITVPELAALAQHKLAALCNAPDTGAAVQVKFADAGKPVHRLAVPMHQLLHSGGRVGKIRTFQGKRPPHRQSPRYQKAESRCQKFPAPLRCGTCDDGKSRQRAVAFSNFPLITRLSVNYRH